MKQVDLHGSGEERDPLLVHGRSGKSIINVGTKDSSGIGREKGTGYGVFYLVQESPTKAAPYVYSDRLQ